MPVLNDGRRPARVADGHQPVRAAQIGGQDSHHADGHRVNYGESLPAPVGALNVLFQARDHLLYIGEPVQEALLGDLVWVGCALNTTLSGSIPRGCDLNDRTVDDRPMPPGFRALLGLLPVVFVDQLHHGHSFAWRDQGIVSTHSFAWITCAGRVRDPARRAPFP